MSELNLTRKTFLEVEELNRFQEFLNDGIARNTIISNTSQYGIIQTDFGSADTNFLVSQGTGANTIQIAKERSQALDIDGNLIRLDAIDNINVVADGNWRWVRISHVFRRHEIGTVSVNANGQLSGSETLFSNVLRGQATDVPVRISFVQTDGTAAVNNGTYEVVNVVNDTNAVLTSTVGFQAETDLRYIVIGSTPIGEVVSPAQLEGIYLYDSCNVELILETTENTPPALPANGENRFFYVSRVRNGGASISIQDQRDIDDTYWKFDVPGLQGAVVSRPLPAPTAVNQYMLIGSIDSQATNYARFFWQGCEPNGGVVIDLRIGNLTIGGDNTPQITDHVIFGDNSTQRPRFFHYVNTTTNRINIYARSSSTFTTGQWLPGYIAFIGENLGAGATSFEFASDFTWSLVAPPTPNVMSTTLFAAYGSNQVITGVNTSLDTINASLLTKLTNSENLSDVSSVTESRSNLNVLSTAEVNAAINARGVLVYAAYVSETSEDQANADRTEHVNSGLVTGVATITRTYRITFDAANVDFNQEYEVIITSAPSNPNSTRLPGWTLDNSGAFGDINLRDSSANAQLDNYWIRIYQWV